MLFTTTTSPFIDQREKSHNFQTATIKKEYDLVISGLQNTLNNQLVNYSEQIQAQYRELFKQKKDAIETMFSDSSKRIWNLYKRNLQKKEKIKDRYIRRQSFVNAKTVYDTSMDSLKEFISQMVEDLQKMLLN